MPRRQLTRFGWLMWWGALVARVWHDGCCRSSVDSQGCLHNVVYISLSWLLYWLVSVLGLLRRVRLVYSRQWF